MLLTCCAFLLAGCRTSDAGWVDGQQLVMGTRGEIRVFHENRPFGQLAIEEAFERMLEIEEVFCVQHARSLISAVNDAAGISSVSVPDEVRFLLEISLEQYQRSNGLFHVGMGHLRQLWGFRNGQPRIPSNDEIRSALENVDLTGVTLTGNQVMIRERGLLLDLYEPMKGYALDEAARVLRDLGIESGLISLGGDVYALGEMPNGGSWQVWIKEPASETQRLLGYLKVSNLAVVSAGFDVPTHFAENTTPAYHQVLHPRTGRLVNNDLTTVIVVCDTGLEGSLHATTAFTMGLEDGYRYIMDSPGVEALMITRDQVIYTTPGLSGMFHLTNTNGFTREVMVLP